MAQKPTSLAAHLQRQDAETRLADAKADAEVSQKVAAEGKVWVRLMRRHYDSSGRLHEPGIAELDIGAVPSSAKILTPAEAAAGDDDE